MASLRRRPGGRKGESEGGYASVTSAEEQHKGLVRRFYEARTKGDLDTLRELLAPGILDHNPRPGQEPGREGLLRAVAEDHAAYSDLQYVVVEQMAAEGERVARSSRSGASQAASQSRRTSN